MALLTKETLNWTTWLEALACLIVFGWIFRPRRLHKGLRLPPGPPGKFIVGNVSDLPIEQVWQTVTQWGEEYGDLVHLDVLGTHIIYVNSAKVAHELFERRSSLYSDRFVSPMLHDLIGCDWIMTFMPYGGTWRRHRTAFNRKFNPASVKAYCDIQTRHTREFLKNLNNSPEAFAKHVRHLAGAIIMDVIYGIQVRSEDDPHIQIAEKAQSAFAEAAIPGSFLVDTFPILKHVPAWMPGAGFRRKALDWRKDVITLAIAPFETVKRGMAAGTAEPSSFVASLLEKLSSRQDVPPDEEEILRNTAGVAYLGGAETVVSSMMTFFLAMVLYPEVQQKAQAEIDRLIGNRLPDFNDRGELPYINALCKEVFRWHPVAPFAVPHMSMQDDVYGDFFIPKGSVLMGNAWAMLRDEKEFGPETDKFKPERFLQPGIKDPTFAFGFGRRICPGRYMADNSIYIAVVSILKTFDISNAKDSDGNDIPVKDAYTSGVVSHPEPFQCTIKRRSGAEKLLSDVSN